MEAGVNTVDAAGEPFSPFSNFVNKEQVATGWKAHPASPSTVTNVSSLPINQSKRNMKVFLKTRLFRPHHDIRSVLYKSLSKRISCNHSMFSQQLYDDFIAECYPDVASYSEAPIPTFITGTDDIQCYYLNDEGKLVQRKILVCINHHFPQILYCPLLPAIVALFLHYDNSASQVFMHVCQIIFSSVRYVHYIDQTKAGVEASTFVLKELVQKYAPSSHKTLLNLSPNPDEIYSHWLNVLFGALPFSYLVVLFDLYLLEGHKALYRTAIAVLKLYRKVGMSNPTDILSAVFDFVKSIDTKVSANVLFRKAFNIKLTSSKEIKKLYLKKLSTVKQQSGAESSEVMQQHAPWKYISFVRNAHSEIANENLLATVYCWIPERYSIARPELLFSTEKNGYSLEAFFRQAVDHVPSFLLIRTTEQHVIGAFLTSDWSERHLDRNAYFGTGETFLFTLVPEQKVYRWVSLLEREDTSRLSLQLSSASSSYSKKSKTSSPLKSHVSKIPSQAVILPPIHNESMSSLVQNRHSNKESREDGISLPPLLGNSLRIQPSSSKASSNISLKSGTESPRLGKLVKSCNELFMYADDKSLRIGGGNGSGIHIDSSFLHCRSERCDTFGNEPLVPNETFQCSLVELFGFCS